MSHLDELIAQEMATIKATGRAYYVKDGPAEGLDQNAPCGPLKMSQQRPPVERYIRCSVTRGGWVVEPGIEWRDGDDFDFVTGRLHGIATMVASRAEEHDTMRASLHGESMIRDLWPGRAFFVEIHDAKCERWTQTYQPYGIPRHR